VNSVGSAIDLEMNNITATKLAKESLKIQN
jgi:hypothetical protein